MGTGEGCAADLSCCHQAASLVWLLAPFRVDWSVKDSHSLRAPRAQWRGHGHEAGDPQCLAQLRPLLGGEVWGGFCLCYLL